MLSSIFNRSTLPALEQTANFAEKRHLLLASNLANIDTPDYQLAMFPSTSFRSN